MKSPSKSKNNFVERAIERERIFTDKRDLVIKTAAKAFNERGFSGTSLDDIAELMGFTKAAIYHYVGSKEEILYECYIRGEDDIYVLFEEISGLKGNGLERLRHFILRYAQMAVGEDRILAVRINFNELTPDRREIIRERQRDLDHKLRVLVQDGINDGSIASCDPSLAAFLLFGAINSVSVWYKPHGRLQSREIAEAFAEMLISGFDNSKAGKQPSFVPTMGGQRTR